MFVCAREEEGSIIISLPEDLTVIKSRLVLVKITSITRHQVKLGIEAQKEIGIDRHEIYLSKLKERGEDIPPELLEFLKK